MERVRRIELPYAAWEAAVLPLNYTRRDLDTLDPALAGVSLASADTAGRGATPLRVCACVARTVHDLARRKG